MQFAFVAQNNNNSLPESARKSQRRTSEQEHKNQTARYRKFSKRFKVYVSISTFGLHINSQA